jgi:hypothetical protein
MIFGCERATVSEEDRLNQQAASHLVEKCKDTRFVFCRRRLIKIDMPCARDKPKLLRRLDARKQHSRIFRSRVAVFLAAHQKNGAANLFNVIFLYTSLGFRIGLSIAVPGCKGRADCAFCRFGNSRPWLSRRFGSTICRIWLQYLSMMSKNSLPNWGDNMPATSDLRRESGCGVSVVCAELRKESER